MKILWFTWKDMGHPFAGGAEFVNEQIAERLVRDGHEVTFLVGGFGGKKKYDHQSEIVRNGYKIIRLGNQWTLYCRAVLYYLKNLRTWPDLVIDESNALPFFTPFYVTQRKVFFIHQLSRKVWFYQMFFPVSLLGYLLEPIYVWLYRNTPTITVSESTKKDLLRFGFKDKDVSIITQCLDFTPIESLRLEEKFKDPTLLTLGTIRPMKRTGSIITAFEIAKEKIPNLKLVVAGVAVGRYGKKILSMIRNSPYASSIEYVGRVSKEEKQRLMTKSHVFCMTSIKEGWGLTVSEAASQGTPSAVYNIDGLRDSVQHGVTGYIANRNTPQGLADAVVHVLEDSVRYEKYATDALAESRLITSDTSYKDFITYAKIS